MGNTIGKTGTSRSDFYNNFNIKPLKKDIAAFIQNYVALQNKMPSEENTFIYADQRLRNLPLTDSTKCQLLSEAQKILKSSSLAPADHGAALTINIPDKKPKIWLVPGTPPRHGDSRSLFRVTDELMGRGLTADIWSAKLLKSETNGESVVKTNSARPTGFQDLVGERNALRGWKDINNENLITYHGSYINGKKVYLAQEKCEGNLSELASIFDRADLEPQTKKEFMYSAIDQILNGLNGLHRAGYSHLDIKPTNIGYTPKGMIKIFDAGTSKKCEVLPPGFICGTAGYTAPELKFKKKDALLSPFACDAYSLGRTIRMSLAMTLGKEAENSLLYQAAETCLANNDINSRMMISQFREHFRDIAKQEGVKLLDSKSLCQALTENNIVSNSRVPQRYW